MKCKTIFAKMVIKNNFLCVEINVTPENPVFIANMDFHLMHNQINNQNSTIIQTIGNIVTQGMKNAKSCHTTHVL